MKKRQPANAFTETSFLSKIISKWKDDYVKNYRCKVMLKDSVSQLDSQVNNNDLIEQRDIK